MLSAVPEAPHATVFFGTRPFPFRNAARKAFSRKLLLTKCASIIDGLIVSQFLYFVNRTSKFSLFPPQEHNR